MRVTELLLASLVFLWAEVLFTGAQLGSSWDYCPLDNYTTSLYPYCFVENYGEPCSGIYCYGRDNYISIFVDKCEDPVSVVVHYDNFRQYFEEFQYVFNQSETVYNDGYYYYYYYYWFSGHGEHEGSYFTGIMDRNATHVGFELYMTRNISDVAEWILSPVYIPLDSADCLCSSMQNVAKDMQLLADYSCNTTIGNCAEVVCDVSESVLQRVSMEVIQCDSPHSLDINIDFVHDNFHIKTKTNKTVEMESVSATLYIQIWQYDYSMDVQLSIVNENLIHIILTRHKIILDLTSCGPPDPIDLSQEPTIPPTSFTEPTAPTNYDNTCTALKSIAVIDGTVCSTNPACTALECEIVNQRLEIAVDSCHTPPGINITLYNSTNNVLFSRSFYDGTSNVSDPCLPMTLNVTVQQLPSSSAISVQVIGELSPPRNLRYVLVPKTVIPIDKSFCTTLVPPTAAPSTTCSAMQYIQTALSAAIAETCDFPISNNCSTLTCSVEQGLDLTIYILRCAHPPAIRIVFGSAFIKVFDHTFDHSEVVPVAHLDNNATLNVTMDHRCPSDIGFQADLNTDVGNATVIPYTVIPIDTTGCGPGSGKHCHDYVTFGQKTCDALASVAKTMETSLQILCAVRTETCGEVDCVMNRSTVNIRLECSPTGIQITFTNSTNSKTQFYSESGTFEGNLMFEGNLSVGVDVDDEMIGFSLSYVYNASVKYPIVNYTRIPVDECGGDSSGNSHKISGSTLAIAVSVPAGVILILSVVIIVIIAGVCHIKRRRYRHYQLHRISMSHVDDDDDGDC